MNIRCYWNRPEATAETIVDGWLHTRDIATFNMTSCMNLQLNGYSPGSGTRFSSRARIPASAIAR